jgi:PIN domain nuclease of toxin-antitoxin system
MSTETTPIEPFYVTDTNALIWYLTTDKKLGKMALRIYEAAARGETVIIVSAISIAELYYSNAKNKWFTDFSALFDDLVSSPRFSFEDFHPEDVLSFDADAVIPEMHDRIITGLARRLDVPLIASDPEIIRLGIVRTVW